MKDYEKFGEAIWGILREEGLVFDLTEGNDIADLAVECGLAIKAPYEPECMPHIEDCEKGDEIYYWGEGYDE